MELDMVRVLLSVAIMAGVTYLLRMLPVTVFQKKSKTGLSVLSWPMYRMRCWRR